MVAGHGVADVKKIYVEPMYVEPRVEASILGVGESSGELLGGRHCQQVRLKTICIMLPPVAGSVFMLEAGEANGAY